MSPLRTLDQSSKLKDVLYEIRGPGAGRGRPARERRSHDPQAQHRQPRGVRVRRAVPDRARHDRGRAARARLQRQPRHHVGAPRRRVPLRAGSDLPAVRTRRRLPRQRRVRAHHDGHAGAARRGRRGADPGARLPAVDGDDEPRRRHARALPRRRAERLAARPRRHPRQGDAAHQGDRRDQPEQPDRRGLLARGPRGHRRHRARELAARALRRDLRPHPVRRRRAHPDGLGRARPAVPHLQRAVQDLPCRRLPVGLARHHRTEGPRRGASSRASPCSPPPACARTSRPSTPCRRRCRACSPSTR